MVHLNTSGSAYDIGLQHGRSCPAAVGMAYEAWVQLEGVDPSWIEGGVRLVEDRLKRSFPEVLREMRGIADGSGVLYEHILTLNCLDAVLPAGKGWPRCSNIGFKDSDAGVLLGKTADWEVAGSEHFAVWQRYRPEADQGYAFIHYGCAGTLWSEGGLNEAGLGMVLNGLPGSGAGPGSVHWLCLTRGVLQYCRSVQDALDFLGRYDVMYWGMNLTLADVSGDMAFVEVVPGARAVRRPEGDYLIHTNHCVCPETLERQPEKDVPSAFGVVGLRENSRARYETLERIVPGAPRTVAGMQALLRDRSRPGPISQNGEAGMRTAYAMVVAPAQGKMWGVEGFPPDMSFVAYQI